MLLQHLVPCIFAYKPLFFLYNYILFFGVEKKDYLGLGATITSFFVVLNQWTRPRPYVWFVVELARSSLIEMNTD
jgi:hypothetical protein